MKVTLFNPLDTPALRFAALFFWAGIAIFAFGFLRMSLRYWSTYEIAIELMNHLLFVDIEYIGIVIGAYMSAAAFLLSYGYRAGIGRVARWVKGDKGHAPL